MFKGLFSESRPQSKTAQFCVDLLRRSRLHAGNNGVHKALPVVYATHHEFIGALLGLVEYMGLRLGDSTPTKEAIRQVIQELFQDNANLAFQTIRVGADSDTLIQSLEETQKYLDYLSSLPRSPEMDKKLLFMSKYFV